MPATAAALLIVVKCLRVMEETIPNGSSQLNLLQSELFFSQVFELFLANLIAIDSDRRKLSNSFKT
jgi:hypothetical protein